MPAEIVAGACAALGAGMSPAPSAAASGSPAAGAGFKLNDLTAGASNTVIESGLDDLLASPMAIVIHRSAADTTAVACADIARS
jgi:hypothetical protein